MVVYQAAAENVGSQMNSYDIAFDGWVESDGHCVNMMREQMAQYGIAETDGYWTMVLAAPSLMFAINDRKSAEIAQPVSFAGIDIQEACFSYEKQVKFLR